MHHWLPFHGPIFYNSNFYSSRFHNPNFYYSNFYNVNFYNQHIKWNFFTAPFNIASFSVLYLEFNQVFWSLGHI
ncbi:hypothetical protein EsH8_X_000049 [Colletotrichum jinshuiense]